MGVYKMLVLNCQKMLEINCHFLLESTCRLHAFGDDVEKKSWRIACHKCRDICPYNLGSKNKFTK